MRPSTHIGNAVTGVQRRRVRKGLTRTESAALRGLRGDRKMAVNRAYYDAPVETQDDKRNPIASLYDTAPIPVSHNPRTPAERAEAWRKFYFSDALEESEAAKKPPMTPEEIIAERNRDLFARYGGPPGQRSATCEDEKA